LGRQDEENGKYWRGFARWELLSGAQSTAIPGLVPKVNYNVVFEDNRLPTGNSGTTTTVTPATDLATQSRLSSAFSSLLPPGPGTLTIGMPTRSSKGSAGAGLGIYPGQWFSRLSALAIEPAFSVSSEEQAFDTAKLKNARTYDLLSLEVYAGQKLELELYQRYWFSQDGKQQEVYQKNLMSRNTMIWRPRPTSPITFAYSYLEGRTKNDPSLMGFVGDPISPWSLTTNQEARIEWLNRWSKKITTRIRMKGTKGLTKDVVVKDSATGSMSVYNYTQYVVGGDIESRLYPFDGTSSMYAYQRFGAFRSIGYDLGSKESWFYAPMAGMIFRMGDRMYLEWQVSYDLESCIAGACKPVSRLDPRLTLTVNL
jgi:hypothetical protein